MTRLAELFTDPIARLFIIWAGELAAGFLLYWGIAREYRARAARRDRVVMVRIPGPVPYRRRLPARVPTLVIPDDTTLRLAHYADREATRELLVVLTPHRQETH